jgi:hypothetical protein
MAIGIHIEHSNGAGDTTGPLESWAELRHLELVKIPGTSDAEEILGTIAARAFESKDVIKLFRQMRWNIKNDESCLRIRLEGDQRSQAAFHNAAEHLRRLGYISRCREEDGLFICCQPSAGKGVPDARLNQFLGGGWFELGAFALAKEVLASTPATIWHNVEVRSGHGLAELDMLALSDDAGTPLVVECKSGVDVEQHFLRFAAVSRMAGVGGAAAVLLVTKIDPQVASVAAAFHDITIVTPDQFAAHIREVFGVLEPDGVEPTEGFGSRQLVACDPRPSEDGESSSTAGNCVTRIKGSDNRATTSATVMVERSARALRPKLSRQCIGY